MVAGQRHLRRANQVQVILGQPVHLGRVIAQEPGAVHDLRPDQRRRDHQGEPVGRRLRRGHVQQRQLQLRANAGEEVEPRAGHLRPALHVDRAKPGAELKVIGRGEVEFPRRANGFQHGVVVLAAGRHRGVHDVGHRAVQRRERLLRIALLRLRGLDLGGQLLALGQQRVPLLAARLADLLAERLLLGAQTVRAGDRGTPPLIGGQQGVDHALVLATGALRRAHRLRIIAQCLEVNHPQKPSRRRSAPSNQFPQHSAEAPRTAREPQRRRVQLTFSMITSPEPTSTLVSVRTCTWPSRTRPVAGAAFAVTVPGTDQLEPAGRSAFASVIATDPNAGLVNTST